MSEDKPPTAKKGGSKIVVIALTAVLVAGAAVAGTMFGPKMLGSKPARAAQSEESAKEAGAGDNAAPSAVANFQPIVVDVHDADGVIHHLKVGLAVESVLENEKEAEAQLKNYMPRGREAAIAFLRGREWDEITSTKRFEPLKKELSAKIVEAMGKERVSRVLVTDFVAQ